MNVDANMNPMSYENFQRLLWLSAGLAGFVTLTLLPRMREEFPKYLSLKKGFQRYLSNLTAENIVNKGRTMRYELNKTRQEFSSNFFGYFQRKEVEKSANDLESYIRTFGIK